MERRKPVLSLAMLGLGFVFLPSGGFIGENRVRHRLAALSFLTGINLSWTESGIVTVWRASRGKADTGGSDCAMKQTNRKRGRSHV